MIHCKQYKNLVYKIIGAAMEVHRQLNWGLLEAVYQEALQLELSNNGIDALPEQDIDVYYKKQKLSKKYRMDLLVDDIILELKSVTSINSSHRAQLCNYLRLTRKPIGLLINFGEEDLKGERWVLDLDTNRCFMVDKNMEPVFEADYDALLYEPITEYV